MLEYIVSWIWFLLGFRVDDKLLAQGKAKVKARDEEIRRFREKYPKPSEISWSIIQGCNSIKNLHEAYAAGRVKVTDVVLYYCHKAIEVHEELNCLTEVMFEEAMSRARELEAGPVQGKLYGIPVSIKDTVSFKGRDSTVGMLKRVFQPKNEHAPIVEQLLDAGAIPFVKTNVPQTLMAFECANPLWGRTGNPLKPRGYTCGGSSGGEAALIASGGSLIGIGSDIGGSLRIPAHFCGISALKPSVDRISYAGSQCYLPATLSVKPVNGPMTKNVEDLVLLSEVLLGNKTHDSRVLQVQSRTSKNKLIFGISYSNVFVEPTPPVQRALVTVQKKLESRGYLVKEFQFPPNIQDYISTYYSLASADGAFHYLKALENEPIDKIFRPLFLLMKVPRLLRKLILMILRWLNIDQRVPSLIRATQARTVPELMSLEGRKLELCRQFDKLWQEAEIDVLICPPNNMPAIPHDSFGELSFCASYTFLWNLLDYSAAVIPMTHVQAGDVISKEYEIGILEKLIKKHYDPVKMEGLPVGVQIVAPPYNEELILKALENISIE